MDSSMQSSRGSGRVIVVSNRLPLTVYQEGDNQWKARPSSGGLVRAMLPVLHDRGGVWIGWPGTSTDEPERMQAVFAAASRESGFDYQPVQLSTEEQLGFYDGFSNEIIWPLFHDLVTHCHFKDGFWEIYERVNRKFTRVLERVSEADDMVWVHDYHLIQLAYNMRQQGRQMKIGFFLHIPFPSPEIFLKLPWRFEILRGLMAYDLLGFQSTRDQRHFLQCMRILHDVSTRGGGAVCSLRVKPRRNRPSRGEDVSQTHEVRVGAFPIGIDFNQIDSLARSPEVRQQAAWLGRSLPGHQMILGVDRLDYTKGLPQKVDAFSNALERYPDMRGKATLVQHVVPSRLSIPDYNTLRSELEQKISAVNGRFTEAGWVPIHYMFHSLDLATLVAYYQAADIALITPPKDGMNLVSKEYCASKTNEDGVLILSEFAGSAVQMQNAALLVNPYDIRGVADALHRAFLMPRTARQERMRRLRRGVRTNDVFHWAETFLTTLVDKNLTHFPVVGDYIPREQ